VILLPEHAKSVIRNIPTARSAIRILALIVNLHILLTVVSHVMLVAPLDSIQKYRTENARHVLRNIQIVRPVRLRHAQLATHHIF
jgi:hypothetical protein